MILFNFNLNKMNKLMNKKIIIIIIVIIKKILNNIFKQWKVKILVVLI